MRDGGNGYHEKEKTALKWKRKRRALKELSRANKVKISEVPTFAIQTRNIMAVYAS